MSVGLIRFLFCHLPYILCSEGYRGVGPMCRHIKDDLEQYYRGVGKPASCDPESQYSELTGVWYA
jgi:hypothetical protein